MDAALPSLHRCTRWHLWGRLLREESSPPRLLGRSYAGTSCWGLLPFICNAHYLKFLSLQGVPKTHDHWLGHVTPGPRAPTSQKGAVPQYMGTLAKRSPKGPPREGVGHWLLVFPSHSGGICGRYSPRELRCPMRHEVTRCTSYNDPWRFSYRANGKQAQGHIVCLWQGRIWNLVFLFPSQLVAFGQWWKF